MSIIHLYSIKVKKSVIILGLISLSIPVVYAGYRGFTHSSESTSPPVPNESTNIGNHRNNFNTEEVVNTPITYTSTKLNISFSYQQILPINGGYGHLTVTEIDNTIYLHATNTNYDAGFSDSITIYKKANPNHNLTEAVQSQILTNIPPEKCSFAEYDNDAWQGIYGDRLPWKAGFFQWQSTSMNDDYDGYMECGEIATQLIPYRSSGSFIELPNDPTRFLLLRRGPDRVALTGEPDSDPNQEWFTSLRRFDQ